MNLKSYYASLVLLVLISMAHNLPAQMVTLNWQVNVSNADDTNNQWLGLPNIGHAIDFIPAGAQHNTFDEDILVLLTGETATAPIRILRASTGEHLYSFLTSDTGDNFRPQSRLATSDDGYIFTVGFTGTVQRYSVTGGTPILTIPSSIYTSLVPNLTGGCRAFEVTGSYSAGTLKIFVTRGRYVFVFGNSPSNPGGYQHLGNFDTGVLGDLIVVAERNGRIYACSIPSPKLKVYDVTYSPFSAPTPQEMSSTHLKYGAALSAAGDILAFTIPGGLTGDEIAVAYLDPTGVNATTIPAVPDMDRNFNGFFDGGWDHDFATSGATSDICIDLATNSMYAYFPHKEPAPSGRSAVIMKLNISASGVNDWTIY